MVGKRSSLSDLLSIIGHSLYIFLCFQIEVHIIGVDGYVLLQRHSGMNGSYFTSLGARSAAPASSTSALTIM
jgi:hypothetical protein